MLSQEQLNEIRVRNQLREGEERVDIDLLLQEIDFLKKQIQEMNEKVVESMYTIAGKVRSMRVVIDEMTDKKAAGECL